MTLQRGIIAAAIAAIVLALFGLDWNSNQSEQPSFTMKLNERVVLPRAELGETMRLETYADDGFTLLSSKVTFRDESTGYVTYRPDRTVEAKRAYYPSDDDSPQLKMEAAYESDGLHLKFERHFYPDGALKREGTRLEDGNYKVVDYHEDGISLASTNVYTNDGNLETYQLWYANGVLQESLEIVKRAKVTKRFDEDGAMRFLHHNSYLTEVWEYYQEDGKTLKTRFEMDSESDYDSTIYFVYADYYNEDGSLNHSRKFYRNRMEVIFKDADGKMIFKQVWKHQNWTEGELTLSQDQYLFASVEFDNHQWASEGFWFFDDGKTIRRATVIKKFPVPFGKRTSAKNYDRETGKLVETRIPEVIDGSIEFITTKFELSDSPEVFDYGQLKPEWLEVYPYSLPPKIPLETEYEDN